MSRSSFVEVDITNPTKLAQDSQNTADNAVKGVTDLSNPNLMSVIEKQNNIGQFAGLTSQYNVLVQNANDEGINTDSLTTAYNNLNKFMIDVLTDPDHASDVNRKTYKNYQDAYNSELAKLQTALKNNTDSKFTSAASATSQAASMASQASNQAQSAVNYTNSQIAVQSQSTANAQSIADNAFSQATTAIDNGKVTSQAVTDLKDGSAMTITDLENGLATKVANSEYVSYKDQTASQIAQKVDNSAFSTYQTQTADLIAKKVANSDFSAYQATTAKEISSKVESSDFNTYKTQTDGMIASKVSTSDFNNLTISNRNLALGTATPITFPGQNIDNQAKVGYQFSSVIPLGTVVTVTFDVSSTTGVGEFVMQFYGDDSGSNWETVAKDNLVNGTKHVSVTLTTTGTHLHIYQRINFATGNIAFSNFIISESSKEVNWTPAPEDQATQTQITQLSDDINLRVTKGDLIDEINLQAGKTLISSSGQLTLSGKTIYFDTANPVIIPSANIESVLVNKKLTAADISANTFSTNNETFTVDKNGAITAKNMTLTGGKLTSPTINTSTINGSTINGTTFHGGDIISDSNNTSQLYPTTISSNGHIYTTGFNSADAMQTDLSTGSLTTKYRATNSSSNQYEAYDTNISPNQIVLLAGHTNGKDMSFSQSVTGSNQDGYVLISPLDGITIHGDTQQIHFNGTSTDVTPKGIAFTPYGNINATGTQGTWYIGNNSNMLTASFGIDNQNNNHIGFYRPLFVDEIGAISSSNGGALFLHGQDNSTGQILLKKDSTGPQVLSASIYNRTYSGGSTVTVTGVGTLGRITSASKYKLAIAREPQVEPADRLLTINPSSWVDLEAAKAVARNKSNGEALLEHEQSLNRYHGLIAEDLRDAGLDEFVIYGVNGEIEGIQYDRLWTVLIPKIKQLNERLNELERKSI
ncbi:hypothetical protein [Lactiplantibacillus plantarum]|uniref:hypothetical protein n=2 Tax=Lactiplantibacillus plantarum TaxID=1590 RepID=UPI00155A6261|nr:hypothetical protein [Lactiplantibacillus plantarum]